MLNVLKRQVLTLIFSNVLYLCSVSVKNYLLIAVYLFNLSFISLVLVMAWNGVMCQIYYLRNGDYFITQVFQAFVSLSHATWHFHVSPFLDMSWYNVTLLCPRHLLYYHCHNTSLNYISKVLLMRNITQTKSQNGHSG